jgi:Domain of unknown function (DUF4461)
MASSLYGGVRSVATTSRSVYVSRLRRAFLLRAHPDRFRSFESEVRQQQETLVKAISNRMCQPDFLAFTHGESSSDAYYPKDEEMLHFSLIRKDGSLLHQTLDLNQPVEDVLHNIASALTLTGAVSMPPPPSAPKETTLSDHPQYGIHWATQSSSTGVDRRYDIHSIRGRDLLSFLQHLDMDQVRSRRSHRLDVTAAALVVRQRFGFSAVDGTGLGWSSASLAILLRSLSAFHIEHCKKLIPTFYPFRLVWSSGDYDDPLDVYGGILYLNPASTPIQWLQQLLIVTDSKLAEHKLHQAYLAHNTNIIASHLGVKIVKGHSCESQHYHELVGRLAHFLGDPSHNPFTSSAVALEQVHIKAESAETCRRPIVTKEGNIRVGTNMSTESIILGISRHAPDARKRLRDSRASRESCKAIIDRAYSELGLERVIPVKPVIIEDMTGALQRLLQLSDRDLLRKSLTGNILAIASTGQFCHVGDDGSFVIPLDWH